MMNHEDRVNDGDADQQADAMRDQLREDVASWRLGETSDTGAKQAMTRTPKQKAKPVPVATPAPTEKKPFKMSYDGTSDRDYAAQRVKLGAR